VRRCRQDREEHRGHQKGLHRALSTVEPGGSIR
jgi:hypothetical protein